MGFMTGEDDEEPPVCIGEKKWYVGDICLYYRMVIYVCVNMSCVVMVCIMEGLICVRSFI